MIRNPSDLRLLNNSRLRSRLSLRNIKNTPRPRLRRLFLRCVLHLRFLALHLLTRFRSQEVAEHVEGGHGCAGWVVVVVIVFVLVLVVSLVVARRGVVCVVWHGMIQEREWVERHTYCRRPPSQVKTRDEDATG